MRHVITALAIISAASACTAVKAVEGPAELRVVASGSNAAMSPAAKVAILAADEATFRTEWARVVGTQELPAVDFETESAVFLLAGERNTGGYSIQPLSATVEGDMLVVEATVRGPGARAIVTQVITSPYAVIAVKARGVTMVRWDE